MFNSWPLHALRVLLAYHLMEFPNIFLFFAVLPQVARNLSNTICDVKRIIGRKYQGASIQQDIKNWPFSVKSGVADKPMIEGDTS